MDSKISKQDYYAQIKSTDIGQIAHQMLNGNVTQETANALLCNCPNHQSQSKKIAASNAR